jgi:hypothetical protein
MTNHEAAVWCEIVESDPGMSARVSAVRKAVRTWPQAWPLRLANRSPVRSKYRQRSALLPVPTDGSLIGCRSGTKIGTTGLAASLRAGFGCAPQADFTSIRAGFETFRGRWRPSSRLTAGSRAL